jgi:hypothetical protein
MVNRLLMHKLAKFTILTFTIGTTALVVYSLNSAEDRDRLPNQKCQVKSGSRSGVCSGRPVMENGQLVCKGGVTEIQYDGCTMCVAQNDATCVLTFPGIPPEGTEPENLCWKRVRVIPCVVWNGHCVEGAASHWGEWMQTPEKDCFLGQ